MNTTWLIIISVIIILLNAILSILTNYLADEWKVILDRYKKIIILFTIIILILLSSLSVYQSISNSSNHSNPTSTTNFSYIVHVQSNATEESLKDAEVIIHITGLAPLRKYTDNRGMAIFIINTSEEGEQGLLTIQAVGYRKHIGSIIFFKDVISDTIQLEPVR